VTALSQSQFPAGWDEEKVRRVLALCDEHTEEEALLEEEARTEPSEAQLD
jgi:hypothetical protein